MQRHSQSNNTLSGLAHHNVIESLIFYPNVCVTCLSKSYYLTRTRHVARLECECLRLHTWIQINMWLMLHCVSYLKCLLTFTQKRAPKHILMWRRVVEALLNTFYQQRRHICF